MPDGRRTGVAALFPAKVQAAHAHSSQHRAEIMDSVLCGCFCREEPRSGSIP